MKSKKNNILENKLLLKTFRNFILQVVACIIIIPIIFLIIAEIFSRIDFEWLYHIFPNFYYFARSCFNYLFDYGIIFFVIAIAWILACTALTYKLLKKVFSYIDEVAIASKQLLDKNVEYIRLSPELEDISIQMNHLKSEFVKNERTARESEQKKNDLIVYLAHDLKTPLTSVIGYLELLKESPDLPIEQRIKYTGITLDKAYRLEELMNEFFEIARFNDTKIVLMKKNLNLKFMLEQIIDEFYPMTNEQSKKIVINCDDDITCYADPDKLSRVFNNVIKNAISYSFENTEININACCIDDIITVSIQNEGYTIPEDKLNSIFEKFYRLDDSRNTSGGGAGLGLAIAKEIISLHGGTIVAESKNNITTFTLKFPKV